MYERVVSHLHQGPVRKIAVPGLILRYVTPELIKDVLAGQCGVEVEDHATAESLFAELAREIALVRQGDEPGRLVLRPELRRTVLENFRSDSRSAATRELIHTEAIRYFSARPGAENRAEEIYHRLWLGQDFETIDARWIRGIELSLRSTAEELTGEAKIFLTNRIGGLDEGAIAQSAPLSEWEIYAAKRASDLLQLGDASSALKVLNHRDERQPGSRLYLIESVVQRSLPTPDLTAAEVAAEKAVLAARTNRDSGEVHKALEELIEIKRLRDDPAGVLRTLAELGNLGAQLGDDLILLQAEVETLESASATGRSDRRLSEAAIRVFSRLPDELISRAPELCRRVAAQVGRTSPEILKRVVRLVGFGTLDAKASRELHDILKSWGTTDPEVENIVLGVVDQKSIAIIAQYLVEAKELDGDVASRLLDWLQEIAVPDAIRVAARRTADKEEDKARGQQAILSRYNKSLLDSDPALLQETVEIREYASVSPDTVNDEIALESIVLRRSRPVLAIKNNLPQLVFQDEADSEIWRDRLNRATPAIERAARSVGRIDLIGADLDWVGGGWLVAENVIVTNRHVAQVFTQRQGLGLTFARGPAGPVGAQIDFLQEADNPDTAAFRLVRPLHVEPHGGPDVAFFEIEIPSGDRRAPSPLMLAKPIKPNPSVGLIGYPSYDSRVAETDLMERIYGRVYDKKRIAVGAITAVEEQNVIHDCAVLGGNSGSVIIDLETGEALGLHFSGKFLGTGYGVRADIVARLLASIGSGAATRGQGNPSDRSFIADRSDRRSADTSRPMDLDRIEGDMAEASDYSDREGYDPTFLGRWQIGLPEVVRSSEDLLSFDFNGESVSELKYTHFSVAMSRSRRMCLFSAVNIDGEQSKKTARVGWKWDPRIPRSAQIMDECYGDPPKFGRGHMTRREDATWGNRQSAMQGNRDAMHVTNVVPQMQALNSPIWLALEDYALEYAREDEMKISVFTGPYFQADDPVMYGVKIPLAFWKVIVFVDDETGKLCATGYQMEQQPISGHEGSVFEPLGPPQLQVTSQVSIRSIELRAGLQFDSLASLDPLGVEFEGSDKTEAQPVPLQTLERICFVRRATAQS